MSHNSEVSETCDESSPRSHTRFSHDDAGKTVVTADGTVVGRIEEVREAEAYLKPDPDLSVGCGSWAAASWRHPNVHRLKGELVAGVTDTVVVLNTAVEGRSPFPDAD